MGFMVCRKSALILTLKDVNWVYLCRPKFKSHFNKILSFTPRPEKLLHVFLSLFLWAFFLSRPSYLTNLSIFIEAYILWKASFWNVSQSPVTSDLISQNIIITALSCKSMIFMLLHILVWHVACLMFTVAVQWWRHGGIILMSICTYYCGIKSLNSLTKFVERLISRYDTCGS